ncbi:MAG: class I SAM-dependent methyltransferase [Thermoplasmata archaeon]|nr:class I SAM-dependent methyltransferase [Thermoplasmata archaeon]
MPEKTDLYGLTYSKFSEDSLAQVRLEAYGPDIGQNSWTLKSEYEGFLQDLGLGAGRRLLDVACGAGGPALFSARTTGCAVVGVDISGNGIQTATRLASEAGLSDRVTFQVLDANSTLPFHDGTFDAIICVDAFIHLQDRLVVLNDWRRLLKPKGRVVFTDSAVVTGLITNEEIAIRSPNAKCVFSPPGNDERLLRDSGFQLLRMTDSTTAMAGIAGARHSARARHEEGLVALEGKQLFSGFQRFLDCVQRLAAERRLSRFVFLAERL